MFQNHEDEIQITKKPEAIMGRHVENNVPVRQGAISRVAEDLVKSAEHGRHGSYRGSDPLQQASKSLDIPHRKRRIL